MRFHTCARFLASALVVARLAGVGPGTAGGSALAAEWSAAQRDSVERLFAVDSHDSRLLEVDVVTGLSSTVDTLFPVSPGSDFRGLEYDGDLGLLLAVESAGHQLRTVDPFTGETAFVCNLATETSRGVAYDASAGVLYVVGWYPWPFESYLYRVHRPTGNTIYVGNIGYEHVSGLAFDRATGVLYGVCDDIFGGTPGRVVTNDVDTGNGTHVATTQPIDDK